MRRVISVRALLCILSENWLKKIPQGKLWYTIHLILFVGNSTYWSDLISDSCCKLSTDQTEAWKNHHCNKVYNQKNCVSHRNVSSHTICVRWNIAVCWKFRGLTHCNFPGSDLIWVVYTIRHSGLDLWSKHHVCSKIDLSHKTQLTYAKLLL